MRVMKSTSTHMHMGLYKVQIDIYGPWQLYQFPTSDLEPSIGTILPVVNLYGQLKTL